MYIVGVVTSHILMSRVEKLPNVVSSPTSGSSTLYSMEYPVIIGFYPETLAKSRSIDFLPGVALFTH